MRPAPGELPAPREPGRYAVALVCLGNICRSPMADVVLARRVDDAGLSARVSVASAGTAVWHTGKPRDSRATGGEVPDPYYGGDQGFEEVLAMVERTSAALVSALQRATGLP